VKQDPFAGLPNNLIPSEPSEAVPEVLAHRPSTAKRDRDWEKQQRRGKGVVTYRGIPDHLQAEIRHVADKHRVPVGEVARAFLEYALLAHSQGNLELHAEFGPGKLTLYPG
jgi:hypothetical protein